MTASVLELRGLSVTDGDTTILRDISLSVSAGEVHVLLGQKGAGKSSLLRAQVMEMTAAAKSGGP
ncbi:MAG: ATP-binding cassette domain-containing protein [Pseudomonadota bacterium]